MSYASQHAAQWRRAGAVRVVIPSVGVDREIPQNQVRIYLDGVDLVQKLLADGHKPSVALRKFAENLGMMLPFKLPEYPIWHRDGIAVRPDNSLIPFPLTFSMPRSEIYDRDLYIGSEIYDRDLYIGMEVN